VETPANKSLTLWLFLVSFCIVLMVVVGGYVRLTRSGLSIVEWNAITGVVPPIGEQAWQAEFAKYQKTPEYQKVNAGMSLEAYKSIYYAEYYHRLIARLVGLAVVLPLLVFLLRGVIPWRKSAIYVTIAALFGFQGFLGWYMVSSGLEDMPNVSHYRLTIHLLFALGLLALCLWTGLDSVFDFARRQGQPGKPLPTRLALGLLVVLVLQIAYGGLVAGLKAGHASDTFPLMFGYWLPPGLFTQPLPWWENWLATPATVQFIHRWFAFVVFGVVLWLYFVVKREQSAALVQRSALAMVVLVCVQVTLGVCVLWFHVELWLALAHQATALLLFTVTIYLNYHLRPQPVVTKARKLAAQHSFAAD